MRLAIVLLLLFVLAVPDRAPSAQSCAEMLAQIRQVPADDGQAASSAGEWQVEYWQKSVLSAVLSVRENLRQATFILSGDPASPELRIRAKDLRVQNYEVRDGVIRGLLVSREFGAGKLLAQISQEDASLSGELNFLSHFPTFSLSGKLVAGEVKTRTGALQAQLDAVYAKLDEAHACVSAQEGDLAAANEEIRRLKQENRRLRQPGGESRSDNR